MLRYYNAACPLYTKTHVKSQRKYGEAEEKAREATRHIRHVLKKRESSNYAIALGTLCRVLKDQVL